VKKTYIAFIALLGLLALGVAIGRYLWWASKVEINHHDGDFYL
jgi:hypothetical protein